jgi:hypothetical protein
MRFGSISRGDYQKISPLIIEEIIIPSLYRIAQPFINNKIYITAGSWFIKM